MVRLQFVCTVRPLKSPFPLNLQAFELNPFKESWVAGPHDTEFYTRTYNIHPASSRPQAHVIYVHGHTEHIGRHDLIFPQWIARGVSVFAFDQRGFGRTANDRWHNGASKGEELSEAVVEERYSVSSWEQQMNDLAFFIRRERERVGDVPIFLVGYSMGGAESLSFACRPHPHKEALKLIKGIIAFSPPLGPAIKQGEFTVHGQDDRMDINWGFNAQFLSRDNRVVLAFRADPFIRSVCHVGLAKDIWYNGAQLLEKHYKTWPEDLPVLVIHGSGDLVITSYADSKAFVEKLRATDKRYSLIPGAFHELHHEPDGVGTNFVNECITWVMTHA
ncbi:Alpha/Beta hydrolase protein [Cantharellus anzutake]|uniref:Alpha/Beta hydrolase protein n=1 Tax=Cantharellus anzutake TaxID=1750568 RepID=UPI0019074BEF|nr:Alpha/Beta hydrolase protein [Cantharellus anzutake]KAF8342948.1 Alpha/Beta hydrolase protein [Cantharellus anzutake]